MLKTVTFKVDDILLERLNAFAYVNGTTKSKVIRDALRLLLQNQNQKKKIREVDKLDGKLIVISFKLDEETLIKLDTFATKNKLSRSAVVRIAVLQYLEENDKEIIQAKVVKIRLFLRRRRRKKKMPDYGGISIGKKNDKPRLPGRGGGDTS